MERHVERLARVNRNNETIHMKEASFQTLQDIVPSKYYRGCGSNGSLEATRP
jgi:hypothetical protein